MSEEILVNASPTEMRVALVENGMLQEVFIERAQRQGYVGNIFKGKVVRVLPGMQAAFVEIGLERAGFIHAADIANLGSDGMEDRSAVVADIRELVREGQTLVVQVEKDPISSKGARLTTHLSISSRFLVFMPYTRHVGISTRIDGEEERGRLKLCVEETMQNLAAANVGAGDGGFIIRTVAEGADTEDLKADIDFLYRHWSELEARIKDLPVKSVIHKDLTLYMRTVRDMVKPHIEKVRVDSREIYGKMVEFADRYAPQVSEKIEHYPGERPLFELYGVEEEIKKALVNKVQLKSGGSLVIEQTEAMVTVDVNTGAFVGHRNLEETIFKTNLEAATAISRQLRLRNLGGIIILDFIDMKDSEHQRQVLRTLEKMMARDHARTTITGVSELGLVEMTRKRTRESLEQVMCEPCPVCQGRGKLRSAETICYEIFREILREARAYNNEKFLLLASSMVIDRLLDEESENVADLEEFIGCSIQFQVENMYSQERYDIILV